MAEAEIIRFEVAGIHIPYFLRGQIEFLLVLIFLDCLYFVVAVAAAAWRLGVPYSRYNSVSE